MSLPEKYLNQIQDIFTDRFSDYLNCLKQPSFNGLRVNTSKISVEKFLKICPFELEPIPWTTDGFYYTDSKVSTHPYYYAGLYYLQEPSAMAPAEILPIEENDLILDACSAPGGKATKLACKLKNTGLLVSNDLSFSRQNATLRNLERFGISNSYVISEDLVQLSDEYPNTFDKILVDAPCSGEGMFRKDPSLIKSWEERNGDYYAPIQKKILLSAVKMLKEGGKMVYSTCTFNPQENEETIQYVLDHCDNMQLEEISLPYFHKGLNGLDKAVRLYPFEIKGEGHFVALLSKKGTKEKKEKSVSPSVSINNEEFTVFMKLVHKDFSDYHFQILNDRILAIPNVGFNNHGIRTLRSGLLVGELKKNHFEPSQAFAAALKENEFRSIINLSAEDIRVEKYLRGETITAESEAQGFVLICVDHYPLGFGKIANHTIKNKIDPGWRKL